MRKIILVMMVLFAGHLSAQQGWWFAQIHRADGEKIVFNFEWKKENGKDIWYIKNAEERMKVDNISAADDSLIIQMPVFESSFHIKAGKNNIAGYWIKGGASNTFILPFTAVPGSKRFIASNQAEKNIAGKWAVKFEGDNTAGSVAEFKQTGNNISGTFLNPSGDYRYLEGLIRNDSLFLSSFDGSHAFLFRALINGNTIQGTQFSGAAGKKQWLAIRDNHAEISDTSVEIHLKPGQDRLHFAFKDLSGKTVSIDDKRFKNKVLVVQLMGSWCPNCMDETAFLSDYYDKNKSRGIEIVSLAYEYSTDWARSVKSLEKFQKRFNVHYPMLITGVSVTDSLRTEKTLPELTPIKTFPSSIIIDKKGKVRKFDTGFNGPATGEHYILYKKRFEDTINTLLRE